MAKADGAWYRVPVLWLGALVFVASLAGCLLTIVLALHGGDPPLAATGASVLRVPLDHPQQQQPATTQTSR
ncbi:MAG: hypothetical protein ABI607_14535 [Betaproteobacteria bacterium]